MVSVAFGSILFDSLDDRSEAQYCPAPACFPDLNLDQVVDAITADWTAYDLKPFFNFPLRRIEAVSYRHEVMADLENPTLFAQVTGFAEAMRAVRGHRARAGKLHYVQQKQAWHLDAVDVYCRAVAELSRGLDKFALGSRGFRGFRDHLRRYIASPPFVSLAAETAKLKAELARLRYCVLVKGSSFTVQDYAGEVDYSVEVEQTFEKFKQGAVKDYSVKFRASEDMNHIEAKILEFVAELNPEVFAALAVYCTRNVDFIDATVAAFDREIHFYIAYLGHIAALAPARLQFCYPRMSTSAAGTFASDGFDIGLACKLVGDGAPVICNDFQLKGEERILVVSGPNQGGKTTFARAFGQIHYLASLGCPVPGQAAQLVLFDQILTHFEKEEKVENLRGKLEDDLTRIRHILDQATSRSIIILNEIFTSTTLSDETFLSRRIMERITALKAACVWVTFVDELASSGPQTVSMVSTVVPENPAQRTFKVVRRPADGLAYAMAVAQKHGLTYAAIKERIRQ